ncbi:MAG: XRE family transcriptional regulator [Hyphomicrobiaceae bacterium]|nr:MAG: XRE family transcriptional regulator [Hyphomicrobiaceae bacterium]
MSQQTKTDFHRKFASRLKSIRLRSGMSQAALAHFLSIPASRIGNWESGRNGPNPSSLGDIAKKLNVSVEFLSGADDLPSAAASVASAAEDAAARYSVRSARLMTRIAELTDVEFARVEAALMGMVDAVLSARPLPPHSGAIQDHSVEMAALDVGRAAVQMVRGRSVSPEPSDPAIPPADAAGSHPAPPASTPVADQKSNRQR